MKIGTPENPAPASAQDCLAFDWGQKQEGTTMEEFDRRMDGWTRKSQGMSYNG